MRFNDGKVIWKSNQPPKQKRFVVRVTRPDGFVTETSHDKERAAMKEARAEAALGRYVEVTDAEGWWI